MKAYLLLIFASIVLVHGECKAEQADDLIGRAAGEFLEKFGLSCAGVKKNGPGGKHVLFCEDGKNLPIAVTCFELEEGGLVCLASGAPGRSIYVK
jgi:hypothetical protein